LRRFLAVLVLLALAAAGAWYHETRMPLGGAAAAPQSLVVPPGASVMEIGRRLHALGRVRHPQLFRLYVLARGEAGRLKAGEYELPAGLALDQIVGKMVRGEVVRRFVTFPEGRTIEDMAGILRASGLGPAGFLAKAGDASLIRDLDPQAGDLEGYLFPDTYDLAPTAEAPAELPARMVGRFRAVVGPEIYAVRASGLTLREVVTLASVVEMETARPEERPRVAAVFLNRLKKGMPLQTDPTVIYALRRAGTWNGNIRREDLDVDSPYNTYRYPGLPPGPIASPGRASLQAVLRPAPVADLYFVSRGDGSHYFSDTLAEHQRAVDHYQRGRGAPPP
jgi:UPF0755 protein